MSEHAPTPWKYNILDDGNFGISAGWTDIATVYNRDDDPVDEANADFIIRACNSHDDLLAALKAIMEMLATSSLEACAYQGPPPKKWMRETAPALDARYNAVREAQAIAKPAIAKAELPA